MKGQLNFRCKQCEAFVNRDVEDVRGELIRFSDMKKPTHDCDDTHIGVLELLGGTVEEGGS